MHVLETNRRDVTSRVGNARLERAVEEKYNDRCGPAGGIAGPGWLCRSV
jgi:hypothetical protein